MTSRILLRYKIARIVGMREEWFHFTKYVGGSGAGFIVASYGSGSAKSELLPYLRGLQGMPSS